MRFTKRQSGIALALVLWMLAALSVLAAGLVAMSREGTGSIDAKMTSAKAFYLGKGAARLVMWDRAHEQSVEWAGESTADDEDSDIIYTASYQFGDVSVTARVFPSSGFMPMPTAGSESWVTFLSRVGGLDGASAAQVVDRFESYFEENEYTGGGSEPDMSTFDGIRSAYTGGSLGGGGGISYVETLLGVEGITREVYERIRRSVAPISGSAAPDPALAPPELKAVFQEGLEAPLAKQNVNTRYFCVELLMNFGGVEQMSQRVWVDGRGAERGQSKLVRVERPVLANSAQAG
ncbi:MAG: hypothetical protein EVA63_08965 [Halieaceae bacterium]|nr:MAG: hypothetical protein EVA63_08965 [Halieaceae bacterium]